MDAKDELKHRFQIEAKARILKMGDNYCIQVIKKRGDLLMFHKLFKEIRGFFGGHVNLNLD